MTSVDIQVRVQPRARREEIVGIRDDVLVVRVVAPAQDGRANLALRRFLAKRLGVPARSVEIVRGERSREKHVRIAGVSRAAVEDALQLG
jgi:uncharacterized protein